MLVLTTLDSIKEAEGLSITQWDRAFFSKTVVEAFNLLTPFPNLPRALRLTLFGLTVTFSGRPGEDVFLSLVVVWVVTGQTRIAAKKSMVYLITMYDGTIYRHEFIVLHMQTMPVTHKPGMMM